MGQNEELLDIRFVKHRIENVQQRFMVSLCYTYGPDYWCLVSISEWPLNETYHQKHMSHISSSPIHTLCYGYTLIQMHNIYLHSQFPLCINAF